MEVCLDELLNEVHVIASALDCDGYQDRQKESNHN
jgi:hypothetical protein